MPSTTRLHSFLAVLLCLGGILPAQADDAGINPMQAPSLTDPLPPKPAGHILDDLHVLRPDMTDELNTRLAATAHEKNVHIYLLTVPRRKTAQLESLAERLAKTWIKNLIGAVIVFDDDTGEMTIATSELVEKEFTSLQLNVLLRNPLLTTTRADQLSRDKLVSAANLLASGLGELKTHADQVAHRGHIANLIMGSIALIGCGLALFSALSKPKAVASSTASAVTINPPADF